MRVLSEVHFVSGEKIVVQESTTTIFHAMQNDLEVHVISLTSAADDDNMPDIPVRVEHITYARQVEV